MISQLFLFFVNFRLLERLVVFNYASSVIKDDSTFINLFSFFSLNKVMRSKYVRRNMINFFYSLLLTDFVYTIPSKFARGSSKNPLFTIRRQNFTIQSKIILKKILNSLEI